MSQIKNHVTNIDETMFFGHVGSVILSGLAIPVVREAYSLHNTV